MDRGLLLIFYSRILVVQWRDGRRDVTGAGPPTGCSGKCSGVHHAFGRDDEDAGSGLRNTARRRRICLSEMTSRRGRVPWVRMSCK